MRFSSYPRSLISRFDRLLVKISRRFQDINLERTRQNLGLDRSTTGPFGYRGNELAIRTDGFKYLRDNVSTSKHFEALTTHHQLRAYVFLQHSYKGELTALLEHYGSDKGSTDASNSKSKSHPWQPHTYGHFYELMFKPMRHTAKLIFECGLGSSSANFPANMGSKGRPGASLRVWRDYFPNAQILGADIDRDSLFSEERILTTYVDQTSEESVRNMWDKFSSLGAVDVIIDDGLHNFGAASTLFRHSFDRLREGGIYIIEDVAPNFLADFDQFFANLELTYQIIATPRQLEMGDNIFITVTK